MPQPTTLNAWKELKIHHEEMRDFSLREEFTKPDRFKNFSVSFENTLFDFSKHLVTDETMTKLIALAKESGLEQRRAEMFSGDAINNTEKRPVLHIACRAPKDQKILVNNENITDFIHDSLEKMERFSDAVRSNIHKGYTNKPITDIVNIGIGGSDLGPRFVTEALQSHHDGPQIHFVSNVDGHDISSKLEKLNPETTLFIIASKTFTTQETMINANEAKSWFLKHAKENDIAKHFVALSTNLKSVLEFGILEENMFPFRDWVGGRYSLWSAIGLSIMLAIGAEKFKDMLSGAHKMDIHFQSAPLEKNIPVLMGVLGVWYKNFYNFPDHLLLPYDTRLGKLAKFIQQMDMESNGKSVDRDGHHVTYTTGPVIFGESGTDSQHSFMQLVHQSPTPIPADFIICKKPDHDLTENHQALCANYLAQTRALALGQTMEEANGDPHRVFSGNRPSTSIILPKLSPYHLGLLIAAFEHKVFVQGIIWNLNSFDQPGVELGKKLALPLLDGLKLNAIPDGEDSSTKGLMKYLL